MNVRLESEKGIACRFMMIQSDAHLPLPTMVEKHHLPSTLGFHMNVHQTFGISSCIDDCHTVIIHNHRNLSAHS